MAKADIEFIVDTLRQSKVDDDLIPALVMTAFFESGLEIEAENTNTNKTKDFGVFQINAASFYDGNKPDPTLKRFFKKMNKTYTKKEFEEFLKNEKYNTIFAAHIVKDFQENSIVDPMTKWVAYTSYVDPFLKGQKIQGRSNEDVIAGIGAYMDAYLQIHNYQQQENLLFKEGETPPAIRTKPIQIGEPEVTRTPLNNSEYNSQVPVGAQSYDKAKYDTEVNRIYTNLYKNISESLGTK